MLYHGVHAHLTNAELEEFICSLKRNAVSHPELAYFQNALLASYEIELEQRNLGE